MISSMMNGYIFTLSICSNVYWRRLVLHVWLINSHIHVYFPAYIFFSIAFFKLHIYFLSYVPSSLASRYINSLSIFIHFAVPRRWPLCRPRGCYNLQASHSLQVGLTVIAVVAAMVVVGAYSSLRHLSVELDRTRHRWKKWLTCDVSGDPNSPRTTLGLNLQETG